MTGRAKEGSRVMGRWMWRAKQYPIYRLGEQRVTWARVRFWAQDQKRADVGREVALGPCSAQTQPEATLGPCSQTARVLHTPGP